MGSSGSQDWQKSRRNDFSLRENMSLNAPKLVLTHAKDPRSKSKQYRNRLDKIVPFITYAQKFSGRAKKFRLAMLTR